MTDADPAKPDPVSVDDGFRDRLVDLGERLEVDEAAIDAIAAHVQLVEGNMHLPGDRFAAPNLALDSLYGLELEPVRRARRIADIGSGAGFPGLVLAIALPEARVTLIDKKSNACRFLRRAVAELALDNVEVVEARAEEWAAGAGLFDVVTSRKVGRPDTIWDWVAPLVAPGGAAILWQIDREPAKESVAEAAAEAAGLRLADVVRVSETPPRHLYLYWRVDESSPSGNSDESPETTESSAAGEADREGENADGVRPTKPRTRTRKPRRVDKINKRELERLRTDPFAAAKEALERGMAAIDAEIETAKDHLDQAKADYEAVKESAAERRAAIQAKLDALESSDAAVKPGSKEGGKSGRKWLRSGRKVS